MPRLIMMFKVILMEEAVFSQRHGTNPGKLTAGTQCHGGLVQMIFLCTWVIFR